MAKLIHVALASTTSKPGDVAGNLQQIETFARQAGADGADLLLTPEMSASGYAGYPEVLATAETAGDGPIYRALAGMAAATGVVVCAGFVEAEGQGRYLAHYVVYPHGAFVVQRKHRVTLVERPLMPATEQLPPYGIDGTGQPAELRFNYFDVRGVRCGITICADGGITNIRRIFAENGVELVLGPAGAGGRREERVVTADLLTEAGRKTYLDLLEMTFLPARQSIDACLKYGQAQAAVNLCGYDGQKLYHCGHGTITTPMGEVVGVIQGLPNLDRQRPLYTHAVIDIEDRLQAPQQAAAREEASCA